MKTILKITLAVTVLACLVPEAHAILGTWRRAARTAVVVESMNAGKSQQSQQQAATAQQQSATAAQQSATAAQQSATAAQQSAASGKPDETAAATHPATPPPTAHPAPDAAAKPLPIGTVVTALPPGCVPTPVGGVEYYYGGGNFYRAVFQGNTLVYVTAEPK